MQQNSHNSKPHHSAQDEALETSKPSASEPEIALLLPKEQRVVLVCDVVESVRWMEHDEDNAIARWSQFAQHVREQIAPAHGGRVVKSTGDGLMLEFDQSQQAIAAAHALHAKAQKGNTLTAEGATTSMPPERQMHLRIGIHQAEVRRDAYDLYGHGVNLAARITTLAGPGEIIVTPEVRDDLTDQLDGQIEDMGECYLKHLEEPQRVYRVGTTSSITPNSVVETMVDQIKLAIVPPTAVLCPADEAIVGRLFADGLITHLGQSKVMKVISRLSTHQFATDDANLSSIASLLGASHVLSGTLTASNQKFVFNLHLCNSKNAEIIWSQRIVATADDLTEESAQLIGDVAQSIHDALTQNLIEPALSKPLPSISSYGLFLAGTNMLHRHCRPDFYRSLSCFDGLVDRHSRHALAYAWRARWRLMAVVNGFSQNSNQDIDLALQDAKAALKFDASHPVSLAVYGQVNNQFLGHEENAVDAFDQALQRDQSECMAWLFKSIHSSMWGDTKLAISQAQQAHELSRLDPHQYYYQMALANAYLSDNQHTKAIEHAENSLRLNASHPATHRILITALYELDRGDQAKEQLNKLLKIQPHLNLKRMASLGSHESRTRKRSLAALQALGIPEH